MTRVSSLPEGFSWQYSGAEGFKGRHAYNPQTGERLSTRAAQDRQSQAHGFAAYKHERAASAQKNLAQHQSKDGDKSRSVKLTGVTDLEKAQKRLLERGKLQADKRTNFTLKTDKRGYSSRVVNSSDKGSIATAASALADVYSDDDPEMAEIDEISEFEVWEYD